MIKTPIQASSHDCLKSFLYTRWKIVRSFNWFWQWKWKAFLRTLTTACNNTLRFKFNRVFWLLLFVMKRLFTFCVYHLRSLWYPNVRGGEALLIITWLARRVELQWEKIIWKLYSLLISISVISIIFLCQCDYIMKALRCSYRVDDGEERSNFTFPPMMQAKK